ncbi:MAG: hypothetical protein K1060chlam2_00467 [Chlamydiae bacterium]|nr:hypothetical protein [Chlamydiota bacterium]
MIGEGSVFHHQFLQHLFSSLVLRILLEPQISLVEIAYLIDTDHDYFEVIMSFNKIPDDCIGHIFSYFSFRELLSSQSLSKTFYKAINEEGSTIGSTLRGLVEASFSNYLVTSNRNWSIPPLALEDKTTVKKIINCGHSLFSSHYSVNVKGSSQQSYLLGEKSPFSRGGEVIAIDQEGNFIIAGIPGFAMMILDKNLKQVAQFTPPKALNDSSCQYTLCSNGTKFNRNTGSLYLTASTIASSPDKQSIIALMWKDNKLTTQWRCDITNLYRGDRVPDMWTISTIITRSDQAFHIIDGSLYKWNPVATKMELVGDREVKISESHTISPEGELVYVSNTGIYSLDLKSKNPKPRRIFNIEKVFIEPGLLRGNIGNLLRTMASFVYQPLVHANITESKVYALTIDSKGRILFVVRNGSRLTCICLNRLPSSKSKQAEIVWKYPFNYKLGVKVNGGTIPKNELPIACDQEGHIFIQTSHSLDTIDIYDEQIDQNGSPTSHKNREIKQAVTRGCPY